MKLSILCGILFLLTTTVLLAQGPITGFMPGKKSWDFALSYGQEQYSSYLFGDEKTPFDNKNQSLSLFIERGLSDSFSLVLSVPYVSIDEVNQGLQDGNLFLKYRNKETVYDRGRLSLISAIGASFPLSRYPIETETPIGERAVSVQGRFLVQYNFNMGLFLHLQSGVNFRVIPTAQGSVPVLLRIGFGTRHLYIDGWLEVWNTINAGVDTAVFGGSGSNWTKVGGTLYYGVTPKIGLFLNGSQTLGGKNIGLSSRWATGVVFKLRKNQ